MIGAIGASVVGMALVALAGATMFVVIRRVRVGFASSRAVPAKRLVLAVGAALLIAFAVSFVTSARATNTQTFALSGAERWTVGPFLYVTFALLLLTVPEGMHVIREVVALLLRSPAAPLVATALLTGLVGLLLGSTTPLQTVQGLALILGFFLFMAVGVVSRPWDRFTQTVLLGVIVGAALLTVALGVALGSFPALLVPACAALITVCASTRLPLVARVGAAAVGAGVLYTTYAGSAASNDPSAGLQLQMGLALAIVVIALLPRRFRAVAGVVLAAGIVVAVARSSLPQISLGGLADDPDLTIAQRGYETQAVWSTVSQSPFTLLLGAGPGATVDLKLSPDAATLLASGRDLAHVPSVHLLTSYLLLKVGLVGLLWLLLIVVHLVVLTARELGQPRPDAYVVLLLCLPWCGLAAAIPAATFFFSNPLCSLGIGLLVSRAISREQEVERFPGVLLPSRSKAVPGPWRNRRAANAFVTRGLPR